MPSNGRRPSGMYRARYRDLAGKAHSRHFDRKVDAQRRPDSVKTAVHTGSYVDPYQRTVGEWAPQWLATKVDLKPTTRRGYEVALSSRILPEWGPVRLGDVSYHGIAEWVARLNSAGLSGATVQHHHRGFSLLLASAVRDGRLARNPAVGVPLPRQARGEQAFLTYEQIDRLAEAPFCRVLCPVAGTVGCFTRPPRAVQHPAELGGQRAVVDS